MSLTLRDADDTRRDHVGLFRSVPENRRLLWPGPIVKSLRGIN